LVIAASKAPPPPSRGDSATTLSNSRMPCFKVRWKASPPQLEELKHMGRGFCPLGVDGLYWLTITPASFAVALVGRRES
jgi:hypothetical protein